VIPNFTKEDQWDIENVEICTSAAAITSASNGSHVALSQHLLGFLFHVAFTADTCTVCGRWTREKELIY